MPQRITKSKRTITLLACVWFGMICFVTTAAAQTMVNDGKNLTARQKAIIPIAAFTATGDLAQLEAALHEGLDAGLTVNEIKEILVHIYAYAGFPRSLNGINTFMAVMDDRQQKGIKDTTGKEASPLPADIDRNQYGEDIRTALTGRVYASPIQDFAPVVDQFLKEHLFADLFVRDNLDHLSRELVTISALTGIGDVNTQLRSHMIICMNLGLTAAQMQDFIAAVEAKVNKTKAKNASAVLSSVIDTEK